MRLLKLLYQYWIKLGKILGFITTTIILIVTYVVMIGPMSLFLRALGKDLLDKRIGDGITFWNPRSPAETSEPKAHEPMAQLEMSRHQF